MAEFSKITLNGTSYDVKDATARQEITNLDTRVSQNASDVFAASDAAYTNANNIAALQTAKVEMEGNISSLAERVSDIETMPTRVYLDSDSTVDDFLNVIDSYSNGIPVVYYDGHEICSLASFIDDPDLGQILYFFNATTHETLRIAIHGSALEITRIAKINVTYKDEAITIW